jgi:hypothetical protein
MKRFLPAFVALIALTALAGCATPPPPEPTATPIESSAVYDIIQHKGTTLGVNTIPTWVSASLDGARAIEKLPEYKEKFIVIVDTTGKNLEGTKLAAANLNAQTEISRYLSIRVRETFAGAQVGDKDKIESYFERVVKSASEAKFSGFQQSADWWVQVRWYKDAKKKVVDKDEYRVIQIWSIDKAILETQLQAILSGAADQEPKTPEKQRAMDLVQQGFFSGF